LPENVRPRIERMLGHTNFDFEWISIYKFQCRRMQRFVHERVIFAGDAAHQVSPFGARGANSALRMRKTSRGNCRWLKRDAPVTLLESYEIERSLAADENIRASTARPISSRRIRRRKAGCGKRCCGSPRKPNLPSEWSMAGGYRRRQLTSRRSRRRTARHGMQGRALARI
jgi:hypothetical protein